MKPRVIFLGPVPPPYMGPTLATTVILGSRLKDEFELLHLDTSDPRDIDTLGAFDFWNIYLALKFYVQLTWRILRHWPELVYVPISQTTIGYLKDSIFILIAKLLGRRVLCHLRGGNWANWMSTVAPLTRRYVHAVHGLVDGQIVLGNCLRPLFADILPAGRIHVVPNGKDISYPAKPPRSARVQFLFLANMVRSKGVIDTLHAIALVHAACPDTEFVFGGGWEDPEVRADVEAFLRNNPQLPIRWLGTVAGAEKNAVINAADVFLFPTYYPPEGHPWVVIEAMAAGLPVISTDQGAIVESVQDGDNGYIVDKRNPAAIAARAMELARNRELRQRMGERSRALYLERFTENRMVEQLAAAFRAAIGAG
jgi:glycosyltransferase involved in cell wall biosynthesis